MTQDTSCALAAPIGARRRSASLIAIALLRRNSSDTAPAAPSDDGVARDDAGHRGGQDTDDLSLWFYRPTAAVIIWRRKYWIVLLAILVAVGTYYGARIPSPSYGSSAVIQVTMQQTSGAPNETLLAANGLAAQYAELATTSAVLEKAAAALKTSPATLSHSISASTVSQLNLVKVSGTGSTPAESQARANAAANALTATILGGNKRKADAFIRKAHGPLGTNSKQISTLEREIARSSANLAKATTDSERAQAQTVLTGQQATLTALISQQNGALSALSIDAALGQPAVAVVSKAGPGSRTRPSPLIFALIGALAGAIVVSQLFVLADSLRRAQRAVSGR